MHRRSFIQSSLAAAATAAMPLPLLAAGTRTRIDSDIAAITLDGGEVTLPKAVVKELVAAMRGSMLLPGSDGYDKSRSIWNGMFDRKPALIAQCSGPADVINAVKFAREHNLLLAVRAGGHSMAGKSVCDGGLMIDLTRMNGVRVDPQRKIAIVEGGSLLGAMDHESQRFGLATTSGTVSHTGTAGLTLGGGHGRLARRFGLTSDNMIAADIVTADGTYLRASADENPELFWGLRGGGGNFGVVTSFEFRLHAMQRQVLAGQIMYPISRVREVLALYGEYAPTVPDELQLDCVVVLPPGGAPGVAGFDLCYSGPPNQADRVLAPLRRLGTPIEDTVRPMDYVALQRSGDTDDFRAQAAYLKSGFMSEIPSGFISAIADGLEGHPDRLTQVILVQGGGAIGRVPDGATAFAQRGELANLLCIVGWPYPTDGSEHIAWIREFWPSLERYTRGFYVNDLGDDVTVEDINANYRGNFNRLVAVKNRYDPNNLFRLNANIKPAAA